MLGTVAHNQDGWRLRFYSDQRALKQNGDPASPLSSIFPLPIDKMLTYEDHPIFILGIQIDADVNLLFNFFLKKLYQCNVSETLSYFSAKH